MRKERGKERVERWREKEVDIERGMREEGERGE
jgi:hypothetical protein